MIEQIGANNQPLIESGSSAGQTNPNRALQGNDVDVSIQVNYAFLIDKAMQPPETDDQLIRQARELLLSGKLDSDDIIEGAVKNLLQYGI
ncbi:MAG: hypothetical protein A2168_02245 [Planctomycetes bacterium RBG_13_50_24]|nr:MAG: hypothetical protein A2168_02245 [Planctomycetes bacterium RBG_13_50_24]